MLYNYVSCTNKECETIRDQIRVVKSKPNDVLEGLSRVEGGKEGSQIRVVLLVS